MQKEALLKCGKSGSDDPSGSPCVGLGIAPLMEQKRGASVTQGGTPKGFHNHKRISATESQ